MITTPFLQISAASSTRARPCHLRAGVDGLRDVLGVSARALSEQLVLVAGGERVVGRQRAADGGQARQRVTEQVRVVLLRTEGRTGMQTNLRRRTGRRTIYRERPKSCE